MKILHSSDWHIGRQFHNVSLLEDQRYVLDQLVDIADSYAVDVVVIAGDVYDRSVPPAQAVSLLDDVLHRLCNVLNIPVIIISGNHDSPQRLGFGARQLRTSGLHIIGPIDASLAPVILGDDFGDVAFYGLPYIDPPTVRDQFDADVHSHDEAMAFLCEQIMHRNKTIGGPRSIVMSHCFLDGGEECDSERPLSVGGAERVSPGHFMPFDYTALGHLHGAQYKGEETIRYSGSILKYSFSEVNQKKSVTLVDMDKNGKCEIDKIALQPLRDMRIIEGELEEILQHAKTDPNYQDYLLVRLTDSHAILNIIGKLRDVYPNVLHIERPGLLASRETFDINRESLTKNETAMFADFYEQVTDQQISVGQQTIVAEIVAQIHRSDG